MNEARSNLVWPGFFVYSGSMTYRFLAFAFVVVFTKNAYADFGDLSVGGQFGLGAVIHNEYVEGQGNMTTQKLMLQPELNLRAGLLDWLHLDTGAGLAVFDGLPAGSIDLGLTAALDVFAIVPELKIGGFLVLFQDGDEFRTLPGLEAAAALRYHLDFNWSVAIGAELNLSMVARYQGTLSFLYVLE